LAAIAHWRQMMRVRECDPNLNLCPIVL
jgi:hypothetical protein